MDYVIPAGNFWNLYDLLMYSDQPEPPPVGMIRNIFILTMLRISITLSLETDRFHHLTVGKCFALINYIIAFLIAFSFFLFESYEKSEEI